MSVSESKFLQKILLLNGPNLNLLGTREPHIYGNTTLAQVEADATATAADHDTYLTSYQSNNEGALIDRIHSASNEGIDGIIINPGSFTHTSVAIRDALLGVNIPFVELHISNIHARPEEWRHKSYFSDKAKAVIMGCGVYGYKIAVQFVAIHFARRQRTRL